MGHPILESFTTTIFMVKEFTLGQTIEFMKVNGDQIKCMEKEHLHGPMEENMWENMLKIRKEDMESLYGQMEDAIVENGLMESSMVRVPMLLLTGKKNMENGKMEKG